MRLDGIVGARGLMFVLYRTHTGYTYPVERPVLDAPVVYNREYAPTDWALYRGKGMYRDERGLYMGKGLCRGSEGANCTRFSYVDGYKTRTCDR